MLIETTAIRLDTQQSSLAYLPENYSQPLNPCVYIYTYVFIQVESLLQKYEINLISDLLLIITLEPFPQIINVIFQTH